MTPTKLEFEFNEQKKRSREDSKTKELETAITGVRPYFSTFLSIKEGGTPYHRFCPPFSHNNHFDTVINFGSKHIEYSDYYLCPRCGAVFVAGTWYWNGKTIGYIDPNKESLSALSNKGENIQK